MTNSNPETSTPTQDVSEQLLAPEVNQLPTITHAIISWLTETAYHNLFEQPLEN